MALKQLFPNLSTNNIGFLEIPLRTIQA